MIRNYLKTALRHMLKNKAHAVLNITGLSAGMAVALLIGLWVWSELSFNRYHTNYDRIAQVKQHVHNNGEIQTGLRVPYPLAEELRKNFANDFTHVALSRGEEDHILSVGNKRLTKRGIYFEPEGPRILTLHMLRGTRDGLKDPSSILLSQSTAKAFFGDKDPINQLMKINNKQDVKVTGVYEDIPLESSFHEYDFMAPWDLFFANTEWIKTAANPWRPNAFTLYVQVAENADMAQLSHKIKDEKLKHLNEQLALKKPALFLDPMSRWHLYSEFKNGVNTGGRIRYVWMFGTAGVFVLLLACINFMNLATARSSRRAKEVGVRKAVGSLRSQLIYQFFVETVMSVLFSFLLALLLVQIALPYFNEVADKKINLPWNQPLFWITGIGFSLVTGLIAGCYPALYLSSFKPIKILKGNFSTGRWTAIPRRAMVVVQFSISVVMIVGTIVVFRQVQHAKNRPLGYNNNGLVSLPMIGESIHKHMDAVKQELFKTGTLTSVAEMGNPVTEIWNTSSGFDWKGKDPNFATELPVMDISYDYGKTVNWTMTAGRDFSEKLVTDSSSLILNEAAVRFMGLQNPVGETIRWFGDPYTVIGVVKDMVMQSPYQPTRPSVYKLYRGSQNFVLAKINPAVSSHAAVAAIEKVFKKFNPSQPFEYHFVDESYADKFKTEERTGKLAGFFAVLAIFISCLGLFGMASFMAEQRTKEIGVRKVLGASLFNVWRLLSKEFILLVLTSLILAWPVSYYFMHNWLDQYSYRINLSWWIFAMAGAAAIFITVVTVSFQAIKAGLANPVKSLRTE